MFQHRNHRAGFVLRAEIDTGRHAAFAANLFDGFSYRIHRPRAVEEAQGRRYLGQPGEPRRRQGFGGIDPIHILRPEFSDQREEGQKVGDQAFGNFDRQRLQLVHRRGLENQHLEVFRLDRALGTAGIELQGSLCHFCIDGSEIDAAQPHPELRIDRPVVKLLPLELGRHCIDQAAIYQG